MMEPRERELMTSTAVPCRGIRMTCAEAQPPVEAARGLDLEVGTGEFFGLLGPNGAGQTTKVGSSREQPSQRGPRAWPSSSPGERSSRCSP